MVIDGHAHAARLYGTAESVRETTDRYGIEKVVLCTSPKNNRDLKEPPNFPFLKSPSSIFLLNRMLRMSYRAFKDYGDGNQYVHELKQQLPERIIQFLWVNPLDPDHLNNLETKIQGYAVKGLKLHQAWDAFTIDGREFVSLAEIARAHGLPIFIHLYSRREAQNLLEFIYKNPETKIIIGHMLGLEIFKEKRGRLSQVFFDTSGSERVRGEDILNAIDLVGDDHVVFGTDTPYARIDDQIQKIDRLNLPDRAKENILGQNMQNLLQL